MDDAVEQARARVRSNFTRPYYVEQDIDLNILVEAVRAESQSRLEALEEAATEACELLDALKDGGVIPSVDGVAITAVVNRLRELSANAR